MTLSSIFKRIVFGKPRPRVIRRRIKTRDKLLANNEPRDLMLGDRDYTIFETGIGSGRWRIRTSFTMIDYPDTNIPEESLPGSYELPQSLRALPEGLTARDAVHVLSGQFNWVDRFFLYRELNKKSRWPVQNAVAAKTPAPV